MTENQENKPNQADEIDLIEVAKKIWAGRRTIYKTVAVFFVIGIIVIIGSPNEYKSEVVLLEESVGKSGGMSGLLSQFGGLAGLSGLGGVAGGDNGLTPDLYPEIIKSTPFQFELLSKHVALSKSDSVITLIDYFNRFSKPTFTRKLVKYTVGLPTTILGAFKKRTNEQISQKPNYPFTLDPKQSQACSELSQRIKVKEGSSANILIISVEMQDPLVVANLTDSVVNCLTKYVTDYRTQKAKKDLKFVEDRYVEAKEKYMKAQQNLAFYRDQNKSIILSSVKTEEERLLQEFNLASSVYNGLAQQFEQSKMKVQENTPVFKVIEPARIGNKSKPQGSIVIVAMLFLGVFFGAGFLFIRMIISSFNISKNIS